MALPVAPLVWSCSRARYTSASPFRAYNIRTAIRSHRQSMTKKKKKKKVRQFIYLFLFFAYSFLDWMKSRSRISNTLKVVVLLYIFAYFLSGKVFC